eukprot:6356472-Prymnesium_polylepis.1
MASRWLETGYAGPPLTSRVTRTRWPVHGGVRTGCAHDDYGATLGLATPVHSGLDTTNVYKLLGMCQAALHVVLVAASCATKPAAASIARRPCASSFSCMTRSSAGSLGFKPSGSKPTSPG